MKPLENKERAWERPARTVALLPGEVEARIGPIESTPEILGGGLANLNVRVGGGRVGCACAPDAQNANRPAAIAALNV